MIKEDIILSIERIVQSLNELTNVHQQLYNVSQQKTEALKDGAADKLQKILNEEQTYIRKLEQVEQKREDLVNQWFAVHGLGEQEQTITKILHLISDSSVKANLEIATLHLTEAITKLQDSEQLNAALIQQSMQFIQTSLNMLKPTLQTLNYNQKQSVDKGKSYSDRSMFDSRA